MSRTAAMLVGIDKLGPTLSPTRARSPISPVLDAPPEDYTIWEYECMARRLEEKFSVSAVSRGVSAGALIKSAADFVVCVFLLIGRRVQDSPPSARRPVNNSSRTVLEADCAHRLCLLLSRVMTSALLHLRPPLVMGLKACEGECERQADSLDTLSDVYHTQTGIRWFGLG